VARTSRQRIILHIGTPKTGTSYVQRGLFDNRAQLSQQGICVPLSGADPYALETDEPVIVHNQLAWAIAESRPISGFSRNEIIESWPKIIAEIRSSRCHTAIITSEVFYWEMDTLDQIEQIKSQLAEFDVFVWVYWRDPAEFCESMYLQAVKDWDYSDSLGEFIAENIERFMLLRRLKKWGRVFGTKSMLIRYYDPLLRVKTFGDYMKPLSVTGINEPFPVTFSQNKSLPEGFLEVFKALSINGLQEAKEQLRSSIWLVDRAREKILSVGERALIHAFLSPHYPAIPEPDRHSALPQKAHPENNGDQ